LNALKKIATIESVGSSTRIEGVKITDQQVEALLSGLDTRSFRSRDEQEVAGYADAMRLVFESFEQIPMSENYIKQLYRILPQHSASFGISTNFSGCSPVRPLGAPNKEWGISKNKNGG
jgi:Fic family protein